MSTKHLLEVLPTYTIISFYIRSVLIGLWIITKWILSYFWQKINIKLNYIKSNEYTKFPKSLDYPTKPPKCLADTKSGIHCYIKLKTAKFHYIEAGNKNDPLMLLLHGYPDCWIGWRHQISYLSKFFHVIVLDLKGYNDSDKPQWRNAYTPQKICNEIFELIKAFDVKTVTIIGHDLGGIIGWIFAHTYPDYCNRFISVSTSHPNLYWDRFSENSVLNQSLIKLMQLPFLPEAELSSNTVHLEKCYSHLLPVKEKNFFYKNKVNLEFSGENAEVMDAYRYIFSRKMDWTGALNYYRNFPFYRIKQNEMIKCPCLIIAGNSDTTCRLEDIIKSTNYCENYMVKIIDGAAHWPHQEVPNEFNKVLLTFLVGNRAETNISVEKSPSRGILSRMIGAVTSNGVKIGGLVLETVNQNTKEVLLNT